MEDEQQRLEFEYNEHMVEPVAKPKKTKKAKQGKADLVPLDKVNALIEGYQNELDTNPVYSLEVDPDDKYKMPEEQKKFIAYYVQFKNIPAAAQLAGIDTDLAKHFYTAYSTQQEIRRINLAMYQRQFATKMLDINEIGGYLTSQIIDDNVPMADRLTPRDKLKAAKMLMELNVIKQQAVSQPEIIDYIDIENQVSDLSPESIKGLINQVHNSEIKNDKDMLIQELNDTDKFTPEELAYMRTLKIEDLKDILDGLNKIKEN